MSPQVIPRNIRRDRRNRRFNNRKLLVIEIELKLPKKDLLKLWNCLRVFLEDSNIWTSRIIIIFSSVIQVDIQVKWIFHSYLSSFHGNWISSFPPSSQHHYQNSAGKTSTGVTIGWSAWTLQQDGFISRCIRSFSWNNHDYWWLGYSPWRSRPWTACQRTHKVCYWIN
jgi:hypothetical protein